MKGKTVVVTGGTSGIGEIAAERLAQMGARIVPDRAEQVTRKGDPRAASRKSTRPRPHGSLRRSDPHL
jgi:NAD(P)-dependent dehydrogenase (short-subunit alcohol dehydrogenase family)